MLTQNWLLGALVLASFCAFTASDTFAKSNLQTAIGMHAPRTTRSFPRIEATFHIPNLEGDPLDFEANDIRAQIRLPDGKSLSLPAFFDGDDVWRMRHTPTAPGNYEVVGITRNGEKLNVAATPAQFKVNGASDAGFIGIDPKNPLRFSFDSGARYYPLGTNQAWMSGKTGEYQTRFAKVGASGQNWSRVWMNHWDGKNLDWASNNKGGFSLDAARRWDEVVEGAAKSGVYFQMVTQHHGQYSSRVNPNWDSNPYNTKNGGFLASPTDFFTDERARTLTKRKLRYAIARYGYSPHILAWELWNEVQFSDAANEKKWDIVAQWHREMSEFLRSQDAYGHLITTSSEAPPEVFASVDYYQRHSYPSNLIAEVSQAPFVGPQWPQKPAFIGEYGSDNTGDRPDEWTMHSGLWASLFSDAAGAAQYWYNDKVEDSNLYHHFSSATDFLKAANFATIDAKTPFHPAPVSIETPMRGPLFLSPGGGWENVTQSDFDLSKAADVNAFGRFPRFFQGQNHHDMNPNPLILHLNAPSTGELRIRLTQIAKAGANLRVTVGDKTTEFPFAATTNDLSEAKTLTVPLSAGAQTISIENTGQDWVVLRDISVPGASMLLDGFAKTTPTCALGWFYHRANIETANPTTQSGGTAKIATMQPGNYAVTWWDTVAGKPLKTETARADQSGLTLQIPSISRDIAVWAVRQ
ncbi:hypothetical protein IAD21_05061 [Abditibacteriota bacterium]|nr:hypothetical protein IAD21_05061 [Abditibacteriota bacterium]